MITGQDLHFPGVDCFHAAVASHPHLVCHGIAVAGGYGAVAGCAPVSVAGVLPDAWRSPLRWARTGWRTTGWSTVPGTRMSLLASAARGAHPPGPDHASPVARAAAAAHAARSARRTVRAPSVCTASLPPSRPSPLFLLDRHLDRTSPQIRSLAASLQVSEERRLAVSAARWCAGRRRTCF
jgi:hypothetical protein